MSLSVEAIDALVASGATAEMLAAVVKAEMSAEARRIEAKRAGNRDRQARKRAKTKDGNAESHDITHVTRDSRDTSPDKEVSPTPPARKLTLVTPPIVPPGGGDAPSEDKTEAEAARTVGNDRIDRIWQAMSAAARRRTSRGDIDAALKAAAKRGHDPVLVVIGLEAYYRSPDATKDAGQFAKGAHRMIQNDRWMAFAEEIPVPESEAEKAEDREAWWGRRVADYVKSRHWNEVDWGPRPGREGCSVPAQILETNGFSERKAV